MFVSKQMILLFFFMQVIQCIGSTYKNCQTFNWPQANVTMINICDILEATEYFEITDNGPFAFFANFSKNTSTGPVVKYHQYFNLRVDSFNSLSSFINLSFLQWNMIKFKGTLYVNFTSKSKALGIEYINKNFGLHSETVKVAGVPYALSQFHFWKALPFNSFQSLKQVDIMGFIRKLVVSGQLEPTDSISYVSDEWLLTGNGTISVNRSHEFKQIVKNFCLESTIVAMNQFRLVITLKDQPELNSSDFSNITSLVAPGPIMDPSETISDFQFLNTPFQLNSDHWVVAGYRNQSWATPINEYGLPIEAANTNLSFRVNFYFHQQDYDINTKKAACIAVLLRDDYSSATQTFVKFANTRPAIEVYICPWWNPFLQKSDIYLRKVIIQSNAFGLYSGSSCLNSDCWPSYTFIPIINRKAARIDILDFVRMAIKNTSNLTIVSVQTGIRFYTGKGRFRFQKFSLELTPKLPAPQQLVPDEYWVPIASFVSLPNVALFLRIFSLLRIVDDMTYYTYHATQYDSIFVSVNYFCWNLTNTKWMIPQIQPIYDMFQISYATLLPEPRIQNTPRRFVDLDGNANFLRQTQEYWISTVPIWSIMFGVFHVLYLGMVRYPILNKIAKIFRRFRWKSFILNSLIGENLQYLSFRCFSQTFDVMVHGQLEYFCLICSYLMLFTILFYAIYSNFAPVSFTKLKRKYFFDGYIYGPQTIFHLTSICLLRVFNGAIHSRLSGLSQVGILLTVQVFIFCLIIYNRHVYEKKITYTCNICQGVFRIILHFVAFLEVYYDYKTMDELVKKAYSSISENLFEIILLACVTDIFTGYFFEQGTRNFQDTPTSIMRKITKKKTNIKSQPIKYQKFDNILSKDLMSSNSKQTKIKITETCESPKPEKKKTEVRLKQIKKALGLSVVSIPIPSDTPIKCSKSKTKRKFK